MTVSESALIFLQGLVTLFDSTSFKLISMGIMVALVGWGVGRFLEGSAALDNNRDSGETST